MGVYNSHIIKSFKEIPFFFSVLQTESFPASNFFLSNEKRNSRWGGEGEYYVKHVTVCVKNFLLWKINVNLKEIFYESQNR